MSLHLLQTRAQQPPPQEPLQPGDPTSAAGGTYHLCSQGTPPLLCMCFLPCFENCFYLVIKETQLALLCQRRYKPYP